MAVPVRLDSLPSWAEDVPPRVAGWPVCSASGGSVAGPGRGACPIPQDVLGAAAQRLEDRSERRRLAIDARSAAAWSGCDLAGAGLGPAALIADVDRARRRLLDVVAPRAPRAACSRR